MEIAGLRLVISGAGIGAGTARVAASYGARVLLSDTNDAGGEALAAAPDPAAMLNTLTHLIPRMGKPEDVAELVCFLASPRAAFINGALWLIDGGSLAWRGTLDILGMRGTT
jgi:NAD(P)-dependent dehydrogenase (short-subunit alcohol dehydrogenase family)